MNPPLHPFFFAFPPPLLLLPSPHLPSLRMGLIGWSAGDTRVGNATIKKQAETRSGDSPLLRPLPTPSFTCITAPLATIHSRSPLSPPPLYPYLLYLPQATSTCPNLPLPIFTFLELSRLAHTYLCLPLPTSAYLHPAIPTYAYLGLPVPTSTYVYLRLPTSTNLYPPLPTYKYLVLPLPDSSLL